MLSIISANDFWPGDCAGSLMAGSFLSISMAVVSLNEGSMRISLSPLNVMFSV